MNASTFPISVTHLLATDKSAAQLLRELLPLVGSHLHADRCFLYLRNPATQYGKIAFCWCRDASVPDVTESAWQFDPPIAQEDPLFAAALRDEPSRFIDDVETADPGLVNRDFEAKTFGHRALIHAHVTFEGQLWGILQPCVFGSPRHWSDAERIFIQQVLPKLQPVMEAYVHETGV